jgi:predicted transposase YbfD/YdcC
MGCQKAIAETIVAGGGDYSLAVKDNQPTLHAEIQAAFATAATPTVRSPRLYTTEDQGHGREEPRTVQVLPACGHLSTAQIAAWVGVLTVVRVTRVVWCKATGVESTEVSYCLSSLRPNARRIGTAIRGHWSIENGLHWVLDVVFREDARRVYDRTAAENVAFLNRLALSLLRGDTGKSSMKVKRKRAGWSLPYLMQLLGFHST